MLSPKNYGSYDSRTDDCPLCEEALLYRQCSVHPDHSACAGWNDDEGANCCVHYNERHGSTILVLKDDEPIEYTVYWNDKIREFIAESPEQPNTYVHGRTASEAVTELRTIIRHTRGSR